MATSAEATLNRGLVREILPKMAKKHSDWGCHYIYLYIVQILK